ncbi:hypothetical protein P5G61_02155 [Paenibacillus sp. F6_3S_P_1C]|uniref:Uncharacterized protein n=1 Tax=Paenibacillus vandeheii TaxID=3035917 RepID=A0ABT8J4Q0_9BACL|nr:hypothetical protein [Paenibacillus vandeheii]MDN4600015.1 hypothetical protein [Paenibacillus vandeheii]
MTHSKTKHRGMREELRTIYSQILETTDVELQANLRVRAQRISNKLKDKEESRSMEEFRMDKYTAGYCMNCEYHVHVCDPRKVIVKGYLYCCEGCAVHDQEMSGYRKMTASRERSHPFEHFYNSYAVIIPKIVKKDKFAYPGVHS